MAEEQAKRLEDVRDERGGRLLARLDRENRRLQVKPYKGEPRWIDLDRLLDTKRAK